MSEHDAALKRGDKVAATARDPKALKALVEGHGDAILPLQLDVTDRDAVFQAVRQSQQHFGRLAVIVSNAGYGLHGAAEEVELDDVRANFETNVFGTYPSFGRRFRCCARHGDLTSDPCHTRVQSVCSKIRFRCCARRHRALVFFVWVLMRGSLMLPSQSINGSLGFIFLHCCAGGLGEPHRLPSLTYV